MLTPKELLEVVDTMQPILDDLNEWITQDMIRRIMARLGRGEDLILTGTDEWQVSVYKEAGGHLEDLQRRIQEFTKASDAEVKAIFEDIGIRAWSADDSFYKKHGHESISLLQSETMLQLLIDTYQRTNGEIHNFTRTTALASQQRLIDLLDTTHFRVMSGAQSYTAAVTDAINDVINVQSKVYYPTGHVDTIETAVLRAVRTGAAQASGNITLQGMIEHDWDLIRVSAHLGARYGDGGENPGNHFWWQGKLYSRTGKTPGYPLFVEATGYGSGDGLCGWNCRHSFGPGDPDHNPYKDYDEEENRKAYDLSQRQRTMERRIRKTKLETMGLNTARQNATGELKASLDADYQKKAVRLQKQNKAYNDFCKENGLKKFDERVAVAKWDRSQAAQAAAAARTHHTEWLKGIGAEGTSLNTVDKYLSAKHNDTDEYRLLKGYNAAIQKGAISPLIGLEQYQATAAAIDAQLVGVTTSTGVQIKDYATHFIDRVIGQTADAHKGMRCSVSVADVLDALINTKDLGSVRHLEDGDIRQTLIGNHADVTISIRDSRIIQANPN